MSVTDYVLDETRFHFTHFKTREFFIKLALASFFGFGTLAFLTMYIHPLPYLFGTIAIFSFLVFGAIEIFGSIVGYIYENSMLDALFNAGLFLVALFITGIMLVYLFLGGVIVFGAITIVLSSVLPSQLTPLLILVYTVGSFAWVASGIEFLDGNKTNPPPINAVARI